jgi:hypothetical protein
MSIQQLIADLTSASAPCRKLDAQIVATVLAPKGWELDGEEDLDGWEIKYPVEGSGRLKQWMCAADVPYVTRYLDACIELMHDAGRADAAALSARALQRLMQDGPVDSLSPPDFGAWLARRVMLELLIEIDGEHCSGGRRAA